MQKKAAPERRGQSDREEVPQAQKDIVPGTDSLLACKG